MFQLRACAVCFVTDKKLLHIDKARLRNDLNWISGSENYPADGMPGYLCVMCTAYLRNCKKFRDKCQRAHYTLLELLRRNNQIKLAHLKAVDCTKLGVAHNLSYLDLNTQHYEEVKFQWVHFNRTGVKQQDAIPIAFCDIAEASYEVPAKKPKQIMTDDDDNNVKLEKQFETLGESIECHDTVTKEEALDHMGADSEKDFDDNFFDGNCSITANNQDSYEIPIEVNEKDTLENADGTDNEFEYATLVPMSFAEAKAALEVSKMFTKGEHKCDVCNRGYCNESRLNIHQRMHDKYVSGFFACVHCSYYYKTDFLLQTHLKEKHMYKYLCRKCPEVSFSRTTAKQHYIRQHMTNDTNKNDDWQKRRPKWLYARGGKRVKGSKPKAGRKEDRHRTPVRTGKPSAKTPEDFPIESPVSQEDQYRLILERKNTKNYLESDYKCQYCYKGFREEVAFNNHMKKHNPEISGPSQCDMCKLYFKNPRKVYKHVTTAHIFKYSCRVCKFFCFNKNQASAHYKWHNNVTYTCPHCNKVFKKISTQLTHIRLKHPSSSICNLCGHSFVSEAGLACHKRITHSEEELRAGEASLMAGPSCSDCGVQFASDRAYRTHLDSSTNHASTANGKRSSGRPRLKRGRTEILNNGVATANHCEVCGKFLVNDVQARQHYETDHPGANYLKRYMCDVCGHTTKQYANLMVHMRTHTREKPYSCPHCDRKFSMTSNRDRHLVVHTGEKRYQCQHCSRRFTQSSAVKLHIQTVHLKIPYAPWDKKTRKRRKELEGAATGPISVVDPVNCLQPQHKLVLDTQGDYLNAYITYSDE